MQDRNKIIDNINDVISSLEDVHLKLKNKGKIIGKLRSSRDLVKKERTTKLTVKDFFVKDCKSRGIERINEYTPFVWGEVIGLMERYHESMVSSSEVNSSICDCVDPFEKVIAYKCVGCGNLKEDL